MITVPDPDNGHILKLIKKVGIQNTSYSVDISPAETALINECFDNVQSHIQLNGGEQINGWQLWQHPFMVEAEFHAIWRSPNGEIVDITPKGILTDKILFIADQNKVFDGKQVDNIRLNTTNNLLVEDFIAMAEAKFGLLNDGEKANSKLIHLTQNESDILKYITGMMQEIETMLGKGYVRNSPCFCTSQLKYKHCHGKDLKTYLLTVRS